MTDIRPHINVLIVGSGGAGCAAALEAKKLVDNVLMITKGDFLASKTANAQGGIQAAIGQDDSPDQHYEDTLKAGEFQNNKKLVEILTSHAPQTIKWLENIGVQFDQNGTGYRLQNAGGLSRPRILSCGDKSGNRLMNPLKKAVEQQQIEVISHTALNNIEKKNQHFEISLVNTKTGKTVTLTTSAVIFATGGVMPDEKKSGLANQEKITIPNTFQLAEMLQLEIVYPDLVQYHPTGIVHPKSLRRKRVPETARSAGANLLNKDLIPFCDPLITRNKLTQLIAQECKEGRGISTNDGRVGVWLNTPKIDEIHGEGHTRKLFPSLCTAFLNEGIDITKEKILIYPILHYSLGGIKIDENTQTTQEGIFAAGEATYGVHGKDRLMGNSLLEIFVFGRIAGQKAAEYYLALKNIKNKH